MCLFPLENSNQNSIAYKKGITHFDCGSCPECLRKRANVWAVRAFYEAKYHEHNCMITLTYDNYVRDGAGRVIGELPPDRDLHVCKRDVQLFIKRLRKRYGSGIKYIACAEYGSRTHRAHYHVILFGVQFEDATYYKASKRGNSIYKSRILTDLWSHGICTIDSVNINSAVARYCTKYTAKSRSEDTFMLFSHHLGLEGMLKHFNGIDYTIEGRTYPIPRTVWNYVITSRYYEYSDVMSYKYVNHNPLRHENIFVDDTAYEKAAEKRLIFRAVRDSDRQYCNYLRVWKERGKQFEMLLPSVETRISLLPENKYAHYKVAARKVLALRRRFVPYPAPNSGCISEYERWKLKNISFYPSFAVSTPCLNTANDTKFIYSENSMLDTPFYIDPFYVSDSLTPIEFERLPKINSFIVKKNRSIGLTSHQLCVNLSLLDISKEDLL